MSPKEYLTKALAGKVAGLFQFVELPAGVVKAALGGKPTGAVENQANLLFGVEGLRADQMVWQSADDWLAILGEL